MDEAALVAFARARLTPLLGNVPEGRFFLAGGAFKSLLHGRAPRDLDLWPATDADRSRLSAQLERRGAVRQGDNPPFQTTYTLRGQVIELAYDTSAATLEERLGRFDLALSAVGVEHRDGIWRAAIHPAARVAVRRREVLLLKPLVNWRYALATLERLRRYAVELGYALPPGEEAAVWEVYGAHPRDERLAMIARYLRICPGDARILREAWRRVDD